MKRRRNRINEILSKRKHAKHISNNNDVGDVYRDIANAAYSEEREIHGYEVVEDNKDWNVRLYRNGSKYVISHRGTASLQDAKTDVSLATGKFLSTDLYKNRVDITKNMLSSLPKDATVDIVGHSLGGTSATFALNDPDINARVGKVHAYNPGTSPFWKSRKDWKGDDSKLHVQTSTGDLVSGFSFPGEKTRVNDLKVGRILKRLAFGPSLIGGLISVGLEAHTIS
jgi:hypothetical protein